MSLRKIVLLSAFLLLSSHHIWAQGDHGYWNYFWDTKAHDRGQIHFSYGYGAPRLDSKLFEFHKNEIEYFTRGIGPFIFKAEYGIKRNLSIGLSFTYIKYNSEFKRIRFDSTHLKDLPFVYGTTVHDIAAMLRVNYHKVITPRLDIYLGGGAGYNMWMSKDYTNYWPDQDSLNLQFVKPFPVIFEASAGFRYFVLNRTALFIEAGYGKSVVQAGVVFKFRHTKRD